MSEEVKVVAYEVVMDSPAHEAIEDALEALLEDAIEALAFEDEDEDEDEFEIELDEGDEDLILDGEVFLDAEGFILDPEDLEFDEDGEAWYFAD